MTALGNNIYEAIIPQHVFGTNVEYSITLADSLGNVCSIIDGFYVKRNSGGEGATSGLVYIGDTTLTNNNLGIFFNINANASWSRNLYFASELSPNNTGNNK